jgi:hypothetical protein
LPMEKLGCGRPKIKLAPFVFRGEMGQRKAANASLLAAFCLLSAGCTEPPKNCWNAVAAAFERLRTSGRPYRKETILGDHQTLHVISEFLPPDRMRMIEIHDTPGDGTVETIQIGSRAWTNKGGSWREFEPTLDAVEMITRTGSVKYMYSDQGPTDPAHRHGQPSLASHTFECLGKVAFKGRMYNGYRESFEAVVSIFSGPLTEKEKEQEEQESLSKSQHMPQTWHTVFVDWPSMLPAWDLIAPESQLDNPRSSTRYSYPDYIWIEPPAR